MEITINKPLKDNYVFIRRETLTKAIMAGNRLKVIVPAGEETINAAEWLKSGFKIEKVFKIKDHPMVLYGGKLNIQNNKQCKIF
ncbi:MAG: hypothetical protein AABY22_15680 [Nanoarchaeota archaeon]